MKSIQTFKKSKKPYSKSTVLEVLIQNMKFFGINCILIIFLFFFVSTNTQLFCRIIYSFTKYFTHTNYMWTFAEGLYLHACVVYGFVNEKYLIYYLMFIGWVSPLIYYVPYVILRGLSSVSDDSNKYCLFIYFKYYLDVRLIRYIVYQI